MELLHIRSTSTTTPSFMRDDHCCLGNRVATTHLRRPASTGVATTQSSRIPRVGSGLSAVWWKHGNEVNMYSCGPNLRPNSCSPSSGKPHVEMTHHVITQQLTLEPLRSTPQTCHSVAQRPLARPRPNVPLQDYFLDWMNPRPKVLVDRLIPSSPPSLTRALILQGKSTVAPGSASKQPRPLPRSLPDLSDERAVFGKSKD